MKIIKNQLFHFIWFQIILLLDNEKVGIKDMLSMMMGSGTKTKSKAQIDEITDYIGATINYSGLDGLFASALKKIKQFYLN